MVSKTQNVSFCQKNDSTCDEPCPVHTDLCFHNKGEPLWELNSISRTPHLPPSCLDGYTPCPPLPPNPFLETSFPGSYCLTSLCPARLIAAGLPWLVLVSATLHDVAHGVCALISLGFWIEAHPYPLKPPQGPPILWCLILCANWVGRKGYPESW